MASLGAGIRKDSVSINTNVMEPPKVTPRSARTPNRPGRKIVPGAPSAHLLSKKDPATAKTKGAENASIEELDQMLEDDALVLLNMKKDITNSQKEELLRLKESVMAVKKDYDTIHVSNNLRDVRLKSLLDQQLTLNCVEQATHASTCDVEELKNSLEQQALVVLDEYEAEQRTIKMQTLMVKRLEKEIAQCRIATSKAVIQVDHAKHDVAITETALQNGRQEVLELELQLERLNGTLKARKDEREKKLHMLSALSHAGETSVSRLQHSIAENTRVSIRAWCIEERLA
jgi:chromosome segregation ATPase